MLTVKVMKRQVDADGAPVPGCFTTKIVEAEEVNIHVLRPGKLTEISTGKEAFYVADLSVERPEGFADSVDFWFSGYVENAKGATVEVVKF